MVWAQTEYEKEERLFQENQSWGRVDQTLGEYMSPDMVYHSRGGYDRPDARRRGNNIIECCCTLQGDFMRWNQQAKGWDLLVLKQQWVSFYPTLLKSENY